ncbi:MAG: 4-hydroxythreonine-4-phosphate dehydrogenase PdxA [Parvibaculaceae bacterium]|nr:4-hydroxythreonine-4-phosphate dehydrogenase PdxA [Parvibaculaceae bacterium]
MATHDALPLALTMGEPAGIGPEITLKAWAAAEDASLPCFFAVGDPVLYSDTARQMGLGPAIREIGGPEEAPALFPTALPVLPVPLAVRAEPGRLDPANATAVIRAIDLAASLALEGKTAGIVTNPIHKRALYDAGFRVPGHTEYLAALCGGATPLMMLSCPGLRVVPITVHLPLREAVASLTAEAIVEQGEILAAALTRDFGITSPRIAVAALNPHAGEEGRLGRAEIEIIGPAVERLKAACPAAQFTGPRPADTLFHAAARQTYDAVLCMYHDQALIPLKTIDFDNGVNTTLGLPIVRTSPDHGTALDIAGKGIAHPGSLIAAIGMARDIARSRAAA